MKKTFVFMMMTVMMLCFMTVSASAENINWFVDSEGVLIVSGTGTMEDYISASAVPWAGEDIYSVVVEEGVTNVGKYAFSGLFLDNVILPASLESIGVNAFLGTGITEAHFAGNLKQWNDNVGVADGNTPLLGKIQMEEDVTYDGDGIHLAKGNLLIDHNDSGTSYAVTDTFRTEYGPYTFSVEFEEGIIEISSNAASNLPAVTSVTIPGSVTSIGESAFSGCSSLTNVTIPNSVTDIGNSVFSNCISLINVMIPDSVTNIGSWAFSFCNSLVEVSIPDSVTSIGDGAFSRCSSMMSVAISDSVMNINDYLFDGCSSLASVIIPDCVCSIGALAFYDCNSLTSVTIPENVTSIGSSAFSDCSSLTRITIPDSVTDIGDSAFYDCWFSEIYYGGTASLWKEINIGENNEILASCEFYYLAFDGGTTGDCRWLLNNNGLLKIIRQGSMADYTEEETPWYGYRDQITELSVGKGVSSIGNFAFYGLTGLESVTGMEGMTSIGAGAFSNCPALENLSIPGTVTAVGENAFSGSTLLTSAGPVDSGAAIEFGWTKAIPTSAFCGADGLQTLTIPEGVTRIMASAMKGCTVLTTLELPTTLTTIQQSAFSDCSLLKEIALPNSLKTLGASAFLNTGLTSITIPDRVTSIGNNAFDGSALTNIYYSGSQKEWNLISVGSENVVLNTAELHFGRFDISIDDEMTHGSVSIAVNGETASSAKEGDTVTLTVAPWYGFELRSLTVNYGENQLVQLSQGAGENVNQWSFTMPDEEASIRAIFGKIRIPYVDENSNPQEPLEVYATVSSGTETMSDGWYVVTESVINDNRLIVSGDVYFLLCDNVTLTLPRGISVTGNNSLTIYGQTKGNGTLNINNAVQDAAGIGGTNYDGCGNITICGGTINVEGKYGGAGIGGGGGKRYNSYRDASGGTISIKGGNVTAIGGNAIEACGAGIGGGHKGAGGVITISGGTITATGGLGGAGIGGGFRGPGGSISISGGTIKALAQGAAAGIGSGIEGHGGSIDITGGTINAIGGVSGSADIGSGSDGSIGTVTITGGEITTYRIGSGEFDDEDAAITLGWTNSDDFIKGKSYGGIVTIADGQRLMDENDNTKSFAGNVLNVSDLANTKLVPDLRLPYSISVSSVENGTVTIDKREAVEGETVTLTVTPAIGYELETLTVKPDETIISVTDNKFTMPGGDVILTATFKALKYRIEFVNEDGTVLQFSDYEYGATPSYIGTLPVKAATAEYTYTFADWTPEVEAVTGNASYKASFTATKNSYTVTWLNDDDSVLDTTKVEYGIVPEHNDAEKPATAEYTYTFAGWTPEVKAVTGNASYKAGFTQAPNIYTITFDTIGGSAVTAITQAYGTAIIAPANPIKSGFSFVRWEPILPTVMPAKNLTVTAIYVPVYGTPDYTLPAFLQTIGDNAFEGADMKVIYVPDSCTYIGNEAFKNCKSLTQIRLPKNCTISTSAFEGCTGLTAIFAQAGGTTESWCQNHPDIAFTTE